MQKYNDPYKYKPPETKGDDLGSCAALALLLFVFFLLVFGAGVALSDIAGTFP